jgi:hypothetical protein
MSETAQRSSRLVLKTKLATIAGRDSRGGLAVRETILSIAILFVLLMLAIPAILQARTAARLQTEKQRLSRMGLGMQVYHDTFSSLPGAGSRFPGAGRKPTSLPK